MAVLAKKMKLKILETPVVHLPRLTGQVSIVRLTLLKACLRVVGELFRLRSRLRQVVHV